MTSLSVDLITSRYVTYMLFLSIRMSLAFLTVGACAGNPPHSLLLHVVLEGIVLRRATAVVLSRRRYHNTWRNRSRWCWSGGYLGYHLPFIRIVRILLDMLTHGDLRSGRCLLGDNLHVTET